MTKQLLVAITIVFTVRLAAQVREVQTRENDSRPLETAAETLERTYGWIVTYEDPPYVFSLDTDDVSESICRSNCDQIEHRTLVPRSTPYVYMLDEDKAKEGELGAPTVIAALLDAHNRSGNPGKFRALAVRVPGGPMVFHIVPYEMRDEHGQSKAYTPLLDTRITIAPGKRSLEAILNEIEAKLQAATGVEFVTAAIGSNYLTQTAVDFDAQNEVARDVLRRLLIEKSGPSSWLMMCDPSAFHKICSLNVHRVQLATRTAAPGRD
jgi:hypothetical protein